MDLADRVLEYLRTYPGKKARDIAVGIGADKALVNSCLYRLRGKSVEQIDGFRWVLKEGRGQPIGQTAARQPAQTPLAKLARYFLACLSKDIERDVSTFASSKYGTPDYAELAALPFNGAANDMVWQSDAVRRVIGRIKQERRSLSLVLGYPTKLSFVRAKSGWEGYFVEPVLLFELDVTGSSSPQLSDERPEINARSLRSLSGQSGSELLDEMILLRQDLGIDSESFSLDDFEEMFTALREVRPDWPWREHLDPCALNVDPPLSKAAKEGLYNRAIVLAAERSPYTHGLETELRELEKKTEREYAATAVGHWLGATDVRLSQSSPTPLIEIVPLNSEQRSAVESCLTRPLTVITGPPGTGKSQVVTSIVANCAWRGQRVLFASKNHKAVDVVESRVNALGPRPVMLRLGATEVQSKLAEYLASLLAATTLSNEHEEFVECGKKYSAVVAARSRLNGRLEALVEARNETDRLEQVVEPLRGAFPGPLWHAAAAFDGAKGRYIIGKAEEPVLAGVKSRQGLFTRLFWGLFGEQRTRRAHAACQAVRDSVATIGIPPIPDSRGASDSSALLDFLDTCEERVAAADSIRKYFEALGRLRQMLPPEEITRELLAIEARLTEVSSSLWDLWLRLQPSRMSQEERRLLGDYKALLEAIAQARDSNERLGGHVYRRFYELFPRLTGVLPAWAVTNLSARGRLPLEPGFFDLLIVDEASQCDIASVLPLLYRCKRAAIIGDPKQLRHITQLTPRVNQELLAAHEIATVGERWSYTSNSLFDLAASLTQSGDVISLRDHHRSRSDIIEFSNEHFYEGRLRVATRESELRIPTGSPAIRWVNVSGPVTRPAGGGAVNREEAQRVVRELERLLVNQQYDGTVGVVSPFRAQANLIRDLVNQNDRLIASLGRAELLIETVYRFQGDERDVMLFSPVVSQGMPSTAEGFLRGNPNTFNVAITRARAALIVVGDHSACTACSVEHLAAFAKYVQSSAPTLIHEHTQLTDLGPAYPAVASPERVSDWERVLYLALYRAGIRSVPQLAVERYVLDFAIQVGQSKLNVEVDGEKYHRAWNGELAMRDQLRNRRLIELGWDVMRFWVYQVRDELHSCVERVAKWVERAKAADSKPRDLAVSARQVVVSRLIEENEP